MNTSRAVEECALRLARVGSLCRECVDVGPWLGIFSYEAQLRRASLLCDAVESAARETDVAINCFAYGKDYFVRYWSQDERERGDHLDLPAPARWRVYDLKNLASAYFLGNAVDFISGLDRQTSSFAWFPLPEGKRDYILHERTR